MSLELRCTGAGQEAASVEAVGGATCGEASAAVLCRALRQRQGWRSRGDPDEGLRGENTLGSRVKRAAAHAGMQIWTCP